MPTMPDPDPPDAAPSPIRAFGRFELRRLLGRSAAHHGLARRPTGSIGDELMLTLPRVAPADAPRCASSGSTRCGTPRGSTTRTSPRSPTSACRTRGRMWRSRAAPASRSPNGWRSSRSRAPRSSPAGCARRCRAWRSRTRRGVAHLDLQLHSLLVDERGHVSVMALGVASGVAAARPPRRRRASRGDPLERRGQRAAAERDVLACGLLLHRLLERRAAARAGRCRRG